MYNLPIYRDGALPATRQRAPAAMLEVLRCDYWVLQLWSHTNLAAPYWRLYWNAAPGAQVLLEAERFALGPDALLLIPPHTPFTTFFNGTGKPAPAENIMVGCPAHEWAAPPHPPARIVHHLFIHFLAGASCDAITPRIFSLPVEAPDRGRIELLIRPLAGGREALTWRESFALHALLHSALAQIPEHLWPAAQTDARVIQAMRHIDLHYGERLTNVDLAAPAAMHAKSFVRLFKGQTQQTPQEYLVRKRLEQASVLLHHTDVSIEEIAARCGFCDRHHLSKVFLRTFGVGPATFRRQRMP